MKRVIKVQMKHDSGTTMDATVTVALREGFSRDEAQEIVDEMTNAVALASRRLPYHPLAPLRTVTIK